MSFDVSWWASHLVSLVLGALVSGLFFLLQAKIDFKALSAEISALSVLVQQFVPFLKIKVEEREVISNASPIERKIFLGLIDDGYKERRIIVKYLSSSDGSMRDPPRGFPLDPLLVPIWMLGGEMAGEHLSGGGEHVTGNLQSLGARFASQDASHVVVHDFDAQVIRGDRHGSMVAQGRIGFGGER